MQLILVKIKWHIKCKYLIHKYQSKKTKNIVWDIEIIMPNMTKNVNNRGFFFNLDLYIFMFTFNLWTL